MQELNNKIAELLTNNLVSIFISYKKGLNGKIKPAFFTKPNEVYENYFGDEAQQNLAVYVHKPEVKKYSKVGILANIFALKALLQLYAENQIKDNYLTIVTVNQDNKVIVFADFNEIESYIAQHQIEKNTNKQKEINELLSLSREKRWEFWVEQLSSCIKCYACRAICPMCYCSKCTVELNQPQWISVPAHSLGNFEWHIMRMMHLACRCINCQECSRVCPMNIPLHLLTTKINSDMEEEFGQIAGMKTTLDFALNTFKVDDYENFIR